MNENPQPANLPAAVSGRSDSPAPAPGDRSLAAGGADNGGLLAAGPAFSPLTQIPLALFAAMLLDVTDVFSGVLPFGPMGVATGLFIGAPLAWFAAKSFGLSQRVRVGAAVAGFVYCIIPGTEMIPAATGVAIIESLVKVIRPSR